MWTYHQATGELFDRSDVHVATGYAGAPEGKNDPTKQDIPKVGPLPRGRYTIGSPHDSPHTGPYTMDLTPDPTNEMYGRGDFRMHGDSEEHPGAASEGCIVMPREVRVRVWISGDHQLKVVL